MAIDFQSESVAGALCTVSSTAARRGFERAFREFGLPEAIRVDNGTPFATMGPGNPGKLGVWWTPHGIWVEFIRRGKPQDNGSHERMHRILKAECCEAAKADRRAQQRRFDQWREEFNGSRPHEALGMRTPSEACRRSGVAYDGRALRAGRRAAARRRVGVDQPGRARPACGGGRCNGPGAAGERSRRGALRQCETGRVPSGGCRSDDVSGILHRKPRGRGGARSRDVRASASL